MRLTKFTDYSLRVLMYLAHAPEGRSTIAEVAAAFGISEHHLVKVVHFLGRERLLINARGRHGGLRLARAAAEINLADVIRLAEGRDLPAECFDRASNTCVLAGGCRLQGALKEALESFYRTLGQYSLADLHMQARKLRVLF
jgi:Rrf2 family nitric oxide-sensitive transcriptional repressor